MQLQMQMQGDYIESIVLAILQGIFEWLPVSSEGVSVLILLNFFGKSLPTAISYAFFLHLGTALAVLIRFRMEFLRMLKGSKMLNVIVVSTLSTAIIAIPLLYFIESELPDSKYMNIVVGALLIFTGIILRLPESGYKKSSEIGVLDMIILGLAQGLAALPGISRSGATISVLLLRKVREEDALKISFIISVPAVLGAVILKGIPGEVDLMRGLIMIGTSCLFGYFTIDTLLRFARKVDFSKFCITFGIVAIVITLISLAFS